MFIAWLWLGTLGGVRRFWKVTSRSSAAVAGIWPYFSGVAGFAGDYTGARRQVWKLVCMPGGLGLFFDGGWQVFARPFLGANLRAGLWLCFRGGGAAPTGVGGRVLAWVKSPGPRGEFLDFWGMGGAASSSASCRGKCCQSLQWAGKAPVLGGLWQETTSIIDRIFTHACLNPAQKLLPAGDLLGTGKKSYSELDG